MADASAAVERGGLARGAIGLREVLSYPISETGLVIGIWYAIGVVVLIYLYIRHPARLPKMQQVFSDDVAPETAGSLAGQEGA